MIAALTSALVAALAASAAGPPFAFTLMERHDFDPPIYPVCLALGDLDGDGLIDAAVAGRNNDFLMATLRGVPGGGFAPPETLWFGHQSNWVEIADVDGDGAQDLLVLSRTAPGALAVMRGLGDGTFLPRENLRVGRDLVQMVVRDLDDDDRPDVVVSAHRSDRLVPLRNRGDGTFEEIDPVRLGPGLPTVARPYSIGAGDLDGDGIDDLAATCLTSGHVVVAPGAAGVGFGPARRHAFAVPTNLDLADADGDGVLDVFAGEFTALGAYLRVMRSTGDLGFEATSWWLDGAFYLWWCSAADLDGDGDPDGILTDALEGSVLLVRNDGEAGFAPPQRLYTGVFPRMVIARDADGDCDLDLYVIDIAGHDLSLWRNETPQAGRCLPADFDGDGIVGFGDLVLLLGAWGAAEPEYDLDGDGTIGFGDVLLLLGSWTP